MDRSKRKESESLSLSSDAAPLRGARLNTASRSKRIALALAHVNKVMKAFKDTPVKEGFEYEFDTSNHLGWPKQEVKLVSVDWELSRNPCLRVFIDDRDERALLAFERSDSDTTKYLSLVEDVDRRRVGKTLESILEELVEDSTLLIDQAKPRLDQGDLGELDLYSEGAEQDSEDLVNPSDQSSEELQGLDGDFFSDDSSSKQESEVLGAFYSDETRVMKRPSPEHGSAAIEFSPGSFLIGRYEIIKELGQGGMGVVYLAVDHLLNKEQVAMKVLHSSFVHQKAYLDRFIQEVQLMRRINHHSVVRTYDIVAQGELVFFTMEYVTGRTILDRLQESRIPLDQIPKIVVEVAEGLKAIHGANIIHRDLTGANILLFEDGSIKIFDFGVARPEDSRYTVHKEIIGSVPYIAPEIWRGEDVTQAIDFYSFGVVLYELLTGKLVFDGKSIPDTMRLHMSHVPPAPRELDSKIPQWLSDLSMKLIEKSPDKRISDARSLLAAVPDQFLSDS